MKYVIRFQMPSGAEFTCEAYPCAGRTALENLASCIDEMTGKGNHLVSVHTAPLDGTEESDDSEEENEMKRSIKWRVYGIGTEDQALSHEPSVHYDFSTPNETRIIDVSAFDKTGSHKYVDVEITCDTYDACYREFKGQLTDGLFENYHYGKVEEICCGFATVASNRK